MHCKSYSHFFSKKFQHICISLDVNFNESLINNIVSFEQLGPDIVKQFLKSEKVTILPHLTYSPELANCNVFLFPKLKKFLSDHQYNSRQALGSAMSQCLRGVPKSVYCDTFQNWIHRLVMYFHQEYFEMM